MSRRLSAAFRAHLLLPSLVVGTLLFVVAVWAAAVIWLSPPVFKPSAAHEAWQQRVEDEVGRITSRSTPQEVQGILDGVLSLRVTAEDRDAQLSLVLALSAFQRATTNTQAYAELRTAYDRTQL